MTGYIQNLIWITLVVSVLMQLLPGEKYNKLFGMAAGWVILIILFSPILNWLDMETVWQQIFAKAIVDTNVELNASGYLQELQADTLENQIKIYTSQWLGFSNEDEVRVSVNLREQEVVQVNISIPDFGAGDGGEERKLQLIAQIADVFVIEEERIRINEK